MPCVALRFACQVQSRAQQNVAKHCTCGSEACVDACVDMRLRVCRDIQPGSELLLYEDGHGESIATKEGKEWKGQEGNYYQPLLGSIRTINEAEGEIIREGSR